MDVDFALSEDSRRRRCGCVDFVTALFRLSVGHDGDVPDENMRRTWALGQLVLPLAQHNEPEIEKTTS